MSLLSIRGLSVTYGATRALDKVDLDLEEGTLSGLIGPNGAGKSTLIDAVTGFIPSAVGEIRLDGEALQGQPASERARRGMSRTFQAPHLFADLTVRENVLVASERAHWYD